MTDFASRQFSVERVDERTSAWESEEPVFRVYLQTPGPGALSYATDTLDVRGLTAAECAEWAAREADRLGEGTVWSVALNCWSRAGEPGLVWLWGRDANDFSRR